MAEKSAVLLVEDNPDDEALALRAIAKSDIRADVFVARDGVEALDWVFARGEYSDRDIKDTPSVILLDLKMPKVDGFDVVREIRSTHQTRLTPIVILTSSKEERDIRRAYDLGVNSYIRKPVDFDDFMQLIGLIGKYWMGINEPPGYQDGEDS